MPTKFHGFLILPKAAIRETKKAVRKAMAHSTNEEKALFMQVIHHPAALGRIQFTQGADEIFKQFQNLRMWQYGKLLVYIAVLILALTTTPWLMLAYVGLLLAEVYFHFRKIDMNFELAARLLLFDLLLEEYSDFFQLVFEKEKDRKTIQKEALSFVNEKRDEIISLTRNITNLQYEQLLKL